MNIATFGSCLSRYTASHYTKLFGGKIISSVYHNRSDAFVGKFIDKNWKDIEFDVLSSFLSKSTEDLNVDNLPINILKNQYEEWMGLHGLKKGIPFIESVNNKLIDFVIMDNYMDLSARLMQHESSAKFFLRPKDIFINKEGWVKEDFLDPVEGASGMLKIVNFIRSKSPKTKILFINFPFNTYLESMERVERTKAYENLFSEYDIRSIPCLSIHESFQTKDKQHFKPQQYAGYAGMAYQIINNH